MASAATRQKILDNAVVCFNRDGIANVRLQHIAEEAGISVGNMTYHFRTKEVIVGAVWEQLARRQRALIDEFRVLPLFEDVDRLLAAIFGLQQEYRFFYLDTLEVVRAYPDIRAGHRQHVHWQVQQMDLAIRFNLARGAFGAAAEPYSEALARRFWMLADQWMYRQKVLDLPENDYAVFRETGWGLFQPYFSDTGWREYRQLNALNLEKKF